MNWYAGNIAEAVAESKAKNAIFVVYIEGDDEMTTNLNRFLNDSRVYSKLQSSDFVAVKIKGSSESYAQFTLVYKMVPVPSIFFIGKSGTPLEIATGIIGSVEELMVKIDSVLLLAGKHIDSEPSTSRASSSYTSEAPIRKIAGAEQFQSDSDPSNSSETEIQRPTNVTVPVTQKIDSSLESTDQSENPDQHTETAVPSEPIERNEPDALVAPELLAHTPVAQPLSNPMASPAAVAAEKRAAAAAAVASATVAAAASAPVTDTSSVDSNTTASSVPSAPPRTPAEEADMRMTDIQNLIERRRAERELEQKRRDKENELRRRRDGREAQAHAATVREQELKEMQQRIRRERQQEQEARERILSQFAADRAEQANRAALSRAEVQSVATSSSDSVAPQVSQASVADTRLQIRMPGGLTRTKAFPSNEPLTTVRQYVITELLPGSNIREFTLATSYPRREFKTEDELQTLFDLNLVPNAVLLVLKNEQTSAVLRTSGNILNIVTSMLWAILTPATMAFDYINNMGLQRLRERFMQLLSNIGLAKAPERPTGEGDSERNFLRREMDLYMRSIETPVVQPDVQSTSTSPTNQPENVSDERQGTGQDLKSSRSGSFRPASYGGSNIRRLADTKDDDEDNATYNGNSTQQQ